MQAKPQAFDRVAYYGRVSTPKQKLEQQREAVERWAVDEGIALAARCEDKVRRHKALKDGKALADVMRMAKAGALDWIAVATFDRFGIKNVDELFTWRAELKRHDVKLYCVEDRLDMTGDDDATIMHVAIRAVVATAYPKQLAEKNVQKMVYMAEQGWATTGNAPYGLDLVCFPINDLTRPMFRVVRMRYNRPHLYKVIQYGPNGEVTKEETCPNMPPRDKKATGYRLTPSVETDRIRAVQQIFQLYAEGMGMAAISDNLFKQGLSHYGQRFNYHGVEVILGNPAYVGLPAFGKVGVGQYLRIYDKRGHKVDRKSSQTFTDKKNREHWVFPVQPVFAPVVDPDLFRIVTEKLEQRPHTNPAFGKRRQRNRASHPLNGKIVCPDCKKPMVVGCVQPAKGEAVRTFVCGTWRKTCRRECNANTVRWELLDRATEQLLAVVRDRIQAVETGGPDVLQNEAWLRRTELGQLILGAYAPFAEPGPKTWCGTATAKVPLLPVGFNPHDKPGERTDGSPADLVHRFAKLFAERDGDTSAHRSKSRKELADLDAELEAVAAELPLQRGRPTIYAKLSARADALERRKAELESGLVSWTDRADAIVEQLHAIAETIGGRDRAARGTMLDSFLDAIVPTFEVSKAASGKRITKLIGFEFRPKDSACKVLPEPMKIGDSRTAKAVFHWLASAFVFTVILRERTPTGRIQKLRQQGKSLADIGKVVGCSEAVVRRVVGPVDKEQAERSRSERVAVAKRIAAMPLTWKQKAARWHEATGLHAVTFWRLARS